ncbi:Uncharacterised protein [Candidatus Bilamarchaeum dharawalense]|uniref:Uncharacterized protein n=1 Tax=Candidatus Bilamarchaeum dharawalense TaxID=2885759 RepID=A0A5E4LM39_9ARCH|nr:Uncharacterised protein [Candidatus Bilamarchaeum dharawalense]
MTSPKAVAFLLLFAGLISALNLSPYFLAGETNVSIAYTNFTIDNVNYSIVKFANVETFLLKNQQIITDQAEFNSVLYTYYVKTYYPNQTEIDDLKAAITTFNNSRNDGYDFKNKEEYVCRDDILLSNGKIKIFNQPVICSDNTSCAKNAMLLFSVYGEGLGLGSATPLIAPLMDFTPSSLKMDGLMINYTTMLDNMTDDTLVSTLEYIKTTSPEIKTLSNKIEYTIFRTPKLNDTADRKACQYKCYALCPSFDLDQNAADLIASRSNALASKIAPLKNANSTAAQMYNRTMVRMDYATNTAIAENYTKIFKPLNETGNATITFAKETLQHVLDPVLSQKLFTLQSLHTSIPASIAQRNFTNLDADILKYKNLTADITTLSNHSMEQYTKTLNAKNIENSLVLVLETRDLDPITMSSLDILKNQTEDLNAQFRDGLSLVDLQSLEGNYTDLSEQAQSLLQNEKDSPAKKAISMFRGFARRINVGIAALADNTNFIPRSEIPDNPWVLGAFSLVTFFSFASLVILFFLYIFALNNFRVPKTSHIIAVALLSILVVLFLFSAFLFMFLGKTSTSATLTEFMNDFDSKQSAAILVDLRNATVTDAQAMQNCAQKLASEFADQNKTWTMYTVTPNTCTITPQYGTNTSSTPADCELNATNSESSFILGYSDVKDALKFSIIYENKAEVFADKEYYDSCPLISMFG